MIGKRNRKRSQGIGCGFMFFMGIVVIGLLSFNVMFAKLFFTLNLSGMDDRLFQSGQFLLPIAMLFIEFWLYDKITFRRGKRERDD